MGLFNKSKKTQIKDHLNDTEYSNLVLGVIEFLFNQEGTEDSTPLPYYAIKQMTINSFTISSYSDYLVGEDDDTYDILQEIKYKIDLEQYGNLLSDIDEGIQHELSKQSVNNLFGGTGNNEKSLEQLNEIIDKVGGTENFNKLLSIGNQNEVIKYAQNEAQKEMKAKKSSSKK